MKMSESSSTKIVEFDILRALAIIMLMVHHSEVYGMKLFGFSLEGLLPYFEATLLGIFFFVSGYFAQRSFQKQNQSGFSFFLARLLRIFPPYLFALSLYMYLLEISFKKRDLIIYLMGAHFLFTPNYTKPVVTIWYVSAIILFYLIFGLLLSNLKSTKGLIIGAVLVYAAAYAIHLWTGLIDERFYKYFIVFLAGILFVRLNHLSKWLSGEQILPKFGIALLWLFIFSLVLTFDPLSPLYILGVVFFIVSWVVLFFALATRIKSPFIIKWAGLISYASFFAYLLHRPLWGWLVGVFAVEASRTQVFFKMIPASIVVFVLSYYLQYGYDRLLAVFRQSK